MRGDAFEKPQILNMRSLMDFGLGLALTAGLTATRHGGAFTPRSLFTTEQGVIYDLTNPATVFQERTGAAATTPSGANGPIGTLKDLSPNNNYCIAPSAAGSPLWRAAGYAEFDGVDDFLSSSFAILQPIVRVSSFRIITGVGSAQIFGGVAANNSASVFQNGANVLAVFSGVVLTGPTSNNGVDIVLTERHNGASSRVAANNGAYTTGDAGVSVPSGVILGAGSGPTAFGTIRLNRVIEIARDLTDAEIALCRTWCGAAVGLVL